METAEYLDLREALFLQAALMDDFLPRDLLNRVIPAEYAKDILLRAQLMSALREKCSTKGDMWQLRPIARRKLLNKKTPQDDLPDTEISAALRAESIYSPESLRKMVEDTAAIETLSVAVATLEQAGPSAPGHAQLVALSSKLDKLRKEKATDTLLVDDFVGRDAEIKRLLDVLDNPERHAPLHTLHVQGLPGVGKTFLLEELSRLCRERPRIVMVKLDFDRSSLSEGSTEAVFEEISRQIGTAMPEVAAELHDLRLRTAERRTRIGTEPTPSVPFDLLHRMIEILAEKDRQLLLLLDTLEVLHGHGATFVNRLLSDVDLFADKERLEISVISAGRGPIFARGDKRLRDLMLLEELDREVTLAILNKRNVPTELHERIIDLSGGNPLRLILVARAVQQDGSNGVLGDTEIRDAGNGYLYRAILSRVPTDLRKIAAEGLILPEVGSWELRNIIGPALNIDIDEERAVELLETLEKQRWMIRQTGEDRFAHTEEVRREILELTYAESPDLTREINQRAAEMLAERDPVLALYHRLQLTRDGRQMPDVPPEIAQRLTDALMEDLPLAAQDAVLRARGQRSRVDVNKEMSAFPAQSINQVAVRKARSLLSLDLWLRALPEVEGSRLVLVDHSGDVPQIDPGGLADLRNMLESRQGREATYILKQIMSTPFRMEGEAGLLALTHQWQTGHWSMAKVLFDHLPDDALDQAVQQDIGLTGLALLEMWAEFRFDKLCKRLGEPHIFDATQHALSLTQRSGINGGALAVAHLVVAGPEMASEHGGVGMLSRYLSDQPTYMDRNMAERSYAMRSEFGLVFKPDQADPRSLAPADFSQVMAPLNPYAEPLRALLEDLADDPDRKVLRDVAALGGHLGDLTALFLPALEGAERAQERAGGAPLQANALLAASGLTAEFATGYSFVSPIPDLPTIARAAERWQQATLGNWQYGQSRPDGWAQTEINPLVLDRAEALLRDPDPALQAMRMLRIWDDPASDGGGSGSAILGRRLAKRYADISALKGLEARIAKLEQSGLTSVMQAPVAVLSELGVPAGEIF